MLCKGWGRKKDISDTHHWYLPTDRPLSSGPSTHSHLVQHTGRKAADTNVPQIFFVSDQHWSKTVFFSKPKNMCGTHLAGFISFHLHYMWEVVKCNTLCSLLSYWVAVITLFVVVKPNIPTNVSILSYWVEKLISGIFVVQTFEIVDKGLMYTTETLGINKAILSFFIEYYSGISHLFDIISVYLLFDCVASYSTDWIKKLSWLVEFKVLH